MPDFEYKAKEGPERVVEGVVRAATEAQALDKIHKMGYIPITVRSNAHGRFSRPSSLVWKSGRKTKKQLIFMSKYLASFLRSGIPILRSLQILAEQEKDLHFQTVLNALASQIRAGKTLSQAMEHFPDTFSPMYLSMVRAGEGGGMLQESLVRMSVYLKKQEALSSQVRQALAYPLFLLVAGIGTVYYILTFAVPRIMTVFEEMGQELPVQTKLVMALAGFMSKYWIWGLGVLFLTILATRQFFSRPGGKALSDQVSLKLPYAGSFVYKSAVARFTRTLSMSLSNGMSFLEGLRISIPTLQNVVLSDAFTGCYQWVQKGDRFGRRLRQLNVIPNFVSDLIMVGEESGRVTESLDEIADTYESEMDEDVHFFTRLLEPVMILLIGSVVGFIVIAMMLPIFEMNVIVR